MPGRIRLSLGGARITSFLIASTLLAEASVRKPSRNITTSSASWSTAYCFFRQLASKEMDLMSQRSQRLSVDDTVVAPLFITSGVGVTSGFAIMNTVGLMPLGKA